MRTTTITPAMNGCRTTIIRTEGGPDLAAPVRHGRNGDDRVGHGRPPALSCC
jgi:hypothetical protein